MDYDFTDGNITKKLIKFTFPIIGAMLLQQLYGAVDLFIVGNYATSADVSAVSTGFQFISMFIGLISGLSIGTTILISQKLGAKKNKDIGEIIGAGLFIFIIISLIITFAVGLNSSYFANMINAPKEAFTRTSQYISTLAFGSIFLVMYNLIGSIFRGLGDSKTPLIAVLIATVINIVLDYVFVARYFMGAHGAAIATVIAQAVSVIFSGFIIAVREKQFDFSIKSIRYSKTYSGKTLLLGSPIAINAFLVTISFTFILAVVNTLGVNASAGVGVTERVIGFLMLIPMAFGQAMASFTAQNVGAGKNDRAKKGFFIAIKVSIIIAIFSIILALTMGKQILGTFSDDAQVIDAAYLYLQSYCFDIFFTAFLFNSIGYFNGYGKTKFNMIHGILGAFLFRIPLAYLFSLITPTSIFLIGLATPCGTVFQLILCFFYYRKLQKEIDSGQISTYA